MIPPGGEVPEELELKPSGAGTRLRLRVRPGAASSRITGPHGGALKVSVSAAPERGKANREVAALLAGALGLPRSAVRIVSGGGSRDKTVHIDLPPDELRRRLP
jgi:uncharacterized protein (TIGR00251 family)